MWQTLPKPELVDTSERMLQVCREVKDFRRAAIDTETTGLDTQKDYVKFWSLCVHPGHRLCMTPDMLHILSKELGNDPTITWIGTNMVYDTQVMENSGVPLFAGPIHCTIVMDTLFDENREGFHGLKPTARDHILLDMNEFKKVFKPRKGETLPETLDRIMATNPEAGIDYASMDAWASLGVYDWLAEQLADIYCPTGISLWDYFLALEAPYTKVLHRIARRGIAVSEEHLESLKAPLERDMSSARRELARMVGREVNMNSPKQLVEVFFSEEGMGIKPIKWTKGGKKGIKQPSTDDETMEILAGRGYDEARIVQRFRSLSKIHGTYVVGMLKHLRRTGRIHTKINQNMRTGRISSSEPNLTNLPRPGTDKYRIRGAFVAPPGRRIKAADYAQIEMRIMAHLSNDQNMIDVIRKGWDIHSGSASIMYDVPYEEIVQAKKEAGRLQRERIPPAEWPERVILLTGYRFAAKAFGFGINYSKGDAAIAEELGISKQEAAQKREDYFRPYPGVRSFVERTHEDVRALGHVNTLLGRFRRLPDAVHDWVPAHLTRYGRWVEERPGKYGAAALRQDVNSRIQGTAAEMIKLAQLYIEGIEGFDSPESERLYDLGAEQLLQVHDEVVLEECDDDGTAAEVDKCLTALMERPLREVPERLGIDIRDLAVATPIDIGWGYNYADAH